MVIDRLDKIVAVAIMKEINKTFWSELPKMWGKNLNS